MLITTEVEVRLWATSYKYYKEKGYNGKYGDIIKVNVSDLPKNSNVQVKVKCSVCNKEYYIQYYQYNQRNGIIFCKDCKSIKTKQTNISKYGVENVFQVKEYQEKQKSTCLQKYGVENVFQNNDIKEKIKSTVLKKYGVENPMKNEDIKKRSQKNCFKSLSKSGKQQCSSQQKYLNELYGGILNYPFELLWLDIYFKKEMIYLEYNGSGHDIDVKYKKTTQEDFLIKEIKRYKMLKARGLKQFIISSKKDKLPSDSVLLSMKSVAFYILLNHISDYIIFDVDENIIKYKNNTVKFDYNTQIKFNIKNNGIVTTKEGNV